MSLFLLLGSLFPSALIENNVKESSQILMREGNIYKFFEFYNVENNNYTDSLMINEAYSIDNTNPFYSYMTVRKNYKEGQTKNNLCDNLGEGISMNNKEEYDPVGELEEFIHGNIDTSMNYARYWHGYLPILRTMLIFFNISEIRMFLLLVFIMLFIYLMYLLKNKLGSKIALVFAIALLIEDYFFVSYSLESSSIFIVMMISCIILLKRIDKIKDWYMYIFIIASIANFVDYLTVPLITLAMPLYIYILYNQRKNKELIWTDYLKLIIKSSIIWFLGYTLTWLSKWIIYDIMLREGLIESAITQVLYRTTRTNIKTNRTLGETIISILLDKIFLVSIIFYAVIIYCVLFNLKIKIKDKKAFIIENIPFLIISLMPFAWYVALANHTILHEFFVYRHLLVFFTGGFICANNLCVIKKENE